MPATLSIQPSIIRMVCLESFYKRVTWVMLETSIASSYSSMFRSKYHVWHQNPG